MSGRDPRSPARGRHRPAAGRRRGARPPRRQRGIVLVLVLTLVVAAALWGLTSSFSTAAQRADRDRATMAAIMQAKEALIARAAMDVSRPGSLVCPDLDNNGNADTTCTPIAGPVPPNSRVGRLPWRTLGLPDLRDASGERLWYALSASLTDRSASQPINSDTQGQIMLTGAAPAQRVVAVIIAPGAPLPGQSRDPAFATQINDVANYLEGENNYKLDSLGDNDDEFHNATASATFNDIVVPITEEELFSVVENMVALRLRKDVKPALDCYRIGRDTSFSPPCYVANSSLREVGWGAYPFPAPFNPGAASPGYIGDSALTAGQLPIDVDPVGYPWTNASVTGISGGTVNWSSCGKYPDAVIGPDWRCTVDVNVWGWSGSATLTLRATAANVGKSFATYMPAWFTGDNPALTLGGSIAGSVDSSGNGRIDVPVRFTADGTYSILFMTTPQANPTLIRGTTTSFAQTQFFFSNEWYRFTYYATTVEALPGKTFKCLKASSACLDLATGGSCASTPGSCIRRDIGTDAFGNPILEDVGALLILAGRVTDGVPQSRPSALRQDYLEGTNKNFPPPATFEQRPRKYTFNDRVVVLAP